MRIFTQSCVVRNNSHYYHQLIRGVWRVTVSYHLWSDSSAKQYDRTLLSSCSLWTGNFSYAQSRTIPWISARCPLVLNSEPRRARCTSRFYRTNTSHFEERRNTLSSRRMVALCKAVWSDDCAELVVWRRIARDVMGFAELPEESQSDPISTWRECRLTYSLIYCWSVIRVGVLTYVPVASKPSWSLDVCGYFLIQLRLHSVHLINYRMTQYDFPLLV